MTDGGFAYTGRDNLEAMRAAARYNAFLAGLARGLVAPGGRLLDFGAGIGTVADLLRHEGAVVDCMEIDRRLADDLTARGFEVFQSLQAVPDRRYDGIYALNVLEHIEDDVGVLAALRGKLRAGGRLLIYVPAFEVLFSDMDRLVGHVRRYTRRGLVQRLERSGFQVLSARYADCLGFPATLAYRFAGGDGTVSAGAVRLYDRWAFPLSRVLDHAVGGFVGKNVYAIGVAA